MVFLFKTIICTNCLIVGNGDLNLYTGLDGDARDLLDDLGGRVKVNYTLVDSHLEAIPGLGTFSTRSFTGRNSQGLRWHTDRSLDLQLLLLSTADQFGAYCNINLIF